MRVRPKVRRRIRDLLRPAKSVLFVRPDYHCSFTYKDELRKLGWKADVYVPPTYPRRLLYTREDIRQPLATARLGRPLTELLNALLADTWLFFYGLRYRTHVYYGRPPEWFRALTLVFPHTGVDRGLMLMKILGLQLVYLPSGCRDEFLKEEFGLLDDGAVCGSCGFADQCTDDENSANLKRIKRHFDGAIRVAPIATPHYASTYLRWKSIDLDLWSPGIPIPEEFRLPPSNAVRIMHSFSPNGRDFNGRNIKGSSFVTAAIERLQREGWNVELIYVSDVESRHMRYYQAQADIIVDQLIYGWWGSTGVEALALGKPLVCYLRPAWKKAFLRAFPRDAPLPIVEATTSNIYETLKELVENQQYRVELGRQSRSFAERHYEPERNAAALAVFLDSVNNA